MENNYIQQLEFILRCEYDVNESEIQKIIEDYRLTVQTIIDETGVEENVVSQLGTPRGLASEIAEEFHFQKKKQFGQAEMSKNDYSTNAQGERSGTELPLWVKIIILIVVTLFLIIPFGGTIFGITAAFLSISLGLIISSVVLAPSIFPVSPEFIILLFLAGIVTLALFLFIALLAIKGLTYVMKLIFQKNKENTTEKKSKRLGWLTLILLVAACMLHASLFTIVSRNGELREKLPMNLYSFHYRNDENTNEVKQAIDASQVKTVKFIGTASELEIVESTDNQYHITGYIKQKDTLEKHVSVKNNELSIIADEKSKEMCFFCIDFRNEKSKFKLEIPKDANINQVKLDITGGSARVEKLKATNISLVLTGGKIRAESLESENITISVTGGKGELENIKVTSKASIEVTGGMLDITSIEAKEARFEVTGGSIDVENKKIDHIEKDVTGGSLKI